jgi:hypothetical protein
MVEKIYNKQFPQWLNNLYNICYITNQQMLKVLLYIHSHATYSFMYKT